MWTETGWSISDLGMFILNTWITIGYNTWIIMTAAVWQLLVDICVYGLCGLRNVVLCGAWWYRMVCLDWHWVLVMLPTLEVGEGREKRERTFNSGTNGAKERVLHARAVNKRGLLDSRVSVRVEFHFVSHASFPAWSFWTEIATANSAPSPSMCENALLAVLRELLAGSNSWNLTSSLPPILLATWLQQTTHTQLADQFLTSRQLVKLAWKCRCHS